MSEHGSFSNEPSYLDDDSSGGGVVRIASVAALGGFLFGYDSAVINGAVSAIEEIHGLLLKDLSLGSEYGFSAACAMLSLFVVARFVRETKGRALEDMTAGH